MTTNDLHIVTPTVQKFPTPDAYRAACAALEKHRQRADAAETELDKLRAELAKARANGASLAAALRAAYTVGELIDLHELAVDQIDGEDTPREDPIGRLADALFAAMAMEPTGAAR